MAEPPPPVLQHSRYVLIGSETGSPIYYDHKDGRMLIPPLITMQEVLEEMFSERADRMETDGRHVFVTAKWQVKKSFFPFVRDF